MKFFAVQIIALLATGALALPSQVETSQLEVRDDLPPCTNTLPACNGGTLVKQWGTNCRCSGMHPTNAEKNTCDVWVCPGTHNNVAVCGADGTGCMWI
ncbi:signal peptide-containing protein [Rutstroemia sp. NJR-2017a WRK4]|nr:signal peptide-containing protein [Rutstroemia sp. NJR-2017a WRK4]